MSLLDPGLIWLLGRFSNRFRLQVKTQLEIRWATRTFVRFAPCRWG
jgi:hypothetical protein